MQKLISFLKKITCDERGGVIIIFAAALPTLIIMASLILDLTYVVDRKRRLQLAADSAAYAGATYVPIYGPSYVGLTGLISNEVTAIITNMFPSGSLPTINPSPSLDTTIKPYTVTVNLSETVNGLLLGAARKLAGASNTGNSIDISVQAKARAQLAGDFCWLALSPTASQSVSFNGSVTVGSPTGSSCGIAVNSNAANAMDSRGSAVSVNVPVSVVGGYQYTGNPPPINLNYSYPVPDPYDLNGTKNTLQGLSVAAFGATGSIKGSGTAPNSNAVSGTHYTNFSSGNTILPSGTYYLDNISMSGNSSVTTAPGASVTIIISPDPNATISMGKNNTFSINAPSSGNLTGIGVTSMSTATAYLYGNPTFSGAMYFPNGSVAMGGNFSSNCMQIISQTISISGNPTISDSGCPNGTPKAQRFLVGLTQ